MSDVLSDEEIAALFEKSNAGEDLGDGSNLLTPDEIDTIGEVANISMGTAATTLFSLVNKKVEISTPVVSSSTWEDIVKTYEKPCVMVKIAYTKGLDGTNILVLKENDVKVITSLMMGGDGKSDIEGEISELHLSAISEAMNQMMGSSATSLSSMLNKMIDISPPSATLINMQEMIEAGSIDNFLEGEFIKITFKMEIGDLVDSKIMQLYPVSLAKEMCASVMSNMEMDNSSTVEEATPAPTAPIPDITTQNMAQQQQMMGQQMMGQQMMGQPMMMNPQMMMGQPMMMQQPQTPVNVAPAQFTPFANGYQPQFSAENIDLIMDVPLEVTVELGRTHKSIQDILDFAPGTIIELNKIAGEPIDVLVNGKYVAKGEVVVIEESFGIRITEIMK